MKGFISILLLTVLFASDYALAQVPFCTCDEQELSNGITGEDIVETLCPGGELGAGFSSQLTGDLIEISGDGLSYSVIIPIDDTPFCQVSQEGVDTKGRKLVGESLAECQARLVKGCDLKRIDPIPTISELGIIVMAGVLGITGLIVAARRRKTAV